MPVDKRKMPVRLSPKTYLRNQRRCPLLRRGGMARGCSLRLTPAFSLIEIVTVISIIGILAAIAMPRFGNSVARYGVEHAAKRLETDLKLIRDQAIHQSRAFEMVFVTGSSIGYSVSGLRHLDRKGIMTYQVDLSEEPYRVSSTSVSVGGDDRIAFDGFGMPDTSGSIILRRGWYTKTVQVDDDSGDIWIDEE